jgi:hypothetical protein
MSDGRRCKVSATRADEIRTPKTIEQKSNNMNIKRLSFKNFNWIFFCRFVANWECRSSGILQRTYIWQAGANVSEDYENNQQDAVYRLIYYSKSALHISSDVFAHHQEHWIVFTVPGSVHPSCRRHQPAASWVNTTRYCKYNPVLLMMGQNILDTCRADLE